MQPFLLLHRQERERKSVIMNIKGSPMFHKKGKSTPIDKKIIEKYDKVRVWQTFLTFSEHHSLVSQQICISYKKVHGTSC